MCKKARTFREDDEKYSPKSENNETEVHVIELSASDFDTELIAEKLAEPFVSFF